MNPSLRAFSFNTRVVINMLKIKNYEISVLKALSIVDKISEKIEVT
jgi:hypothetical protein